MLRARTFVFAVHGFAVKHRSKLVRTKLQPTIEYIRPAIRLPCADQSVCTAVILEVRDTTNAILSRALLI